LKNIFRSAIAAVLTLEVHGEIPQRAVSVVERMAALPEPLEVRDWQIVARQYYSLLFVSMRLKGPSA